MQSIRYKKKTMNEPAASQRQDRQRNKTDTRRGAEGEGDESCAHCENEDQITVTS